MLVTTQSAEIMLLFAQFINPEDQKRTHTIIVELLCQIAYENFCMILYISIIELKKSYKTKLLFLKCKLDFIKTSEQKIIFTHFFALLKNTSRRVNIYTPALYVFAKYLILSREKV